MCVVSMIYDLGASNPPWNQPSFAPLPQQQPLPDAKALEAIKRFLELVDAAKKLDAAMGAPDCEDPKKAKFEAEVLKRLEALEQKLSKHPSLFGDKP